MSNDLLSLKNAYENFKNQIKMTFLLKNVLQKKANIIQNSAILEKLNKFLVEAENN